MHKWAFVAVPGTGPETKRIRAGLIGVCSECGLIRSTVVIAGAETQIVLTGPCPGRTGVDRTLHGS